MKRLILIFIFISTNLFSMTWEFQFKIFRVINGVQVHEPNVAIYISVFDASTGTVVPNTTSYGSTFGYGAYSGEFNAACDIEGVNEPGDTTPNIQPMLPAASYYIIKIGTVYFRIRHLSNADETFYYNLDTGILTLSINNYEVQSSGIGTSHSILLKNNYDGGAMYIDDIYESGIDLNGRVVNRVDYSFPHSLTAVPGLFGTDGYKRLWRIWSNDYSPISQTLNSPGNYSYEARFDREFNLTFQTGGKPFTADGYNYSSDATLYKREQSTFTASASNTTDNDVSFTFLYWKKDGNIVSNNITAAGNAAYVAWYSAKPNVNNRNLTSNSQVG